MITGISFEYCGAKQQAHYIVYDTDFELNIETTMLSFTSNPYIFECLKVIIDVYKEKQLNVAANIAHWLIIFYPSTAHSYLEQFKMNIPSYNKYANDVEKYLLLM